MRRATIQINQNNTKSLLITGLIQLGVEKKNNKEKELTYLSHTVKAT